jgi:hypothetical protein
VAVRVRGEVHGVASRPRGARNLQQSTKTQDT